MNKFKQKFSDKILIFLLKCGFRTKDEFYLTNQNLSLKDMLKYNYLPHPCTSDILLSHQSLSEKNLDKLISHCYHNQIHFQAYYVSKNPNLSARIIRKYPNIDWYHNCISNLTEEEFKELFPKIPIECYILRLNNLDDEKVEKIKHKLKPGMMANANSKVSLECIFKMNNLIWDGILEREDFKFELLEQSGYNTRWIRLGIFSKINTLDTLEKIVKKYSSKRDYLDFYSGLGLDAIEIEKFIDKYNLKIDSVLNCKNLTFKLGLKYFENRYYDRLNEHEFSRNENLTRKFILENFVGDLYDIYFDICMNNFTMEKINQRLSFEREIKIKRLFCVVF